MRTLIVSDLHLGSRSRADLLRFGPGRDLLLGELDGVDRLVLLGDVLELRGGRVREVFAAALPFFDELGRVFAGGEVVVSAGNHDHALVDGWLARRAGRAKGIGLEQRPGIEQAAPILAALARRAAPASITLAYPGIWVRDDVYATHGHYLDCHLTMLSVERLAIAAMRGLLRRSSATIRCVEDYEMVTARAYRSLDLIERRAVRSAVEDSRRDPGIERQPDRSDQLERARPRPMFSQFPGKVRPLAGAAIRRAVPRGLRLSGDELYRAELSAMGEVAARLGLGDAYVVFGHTHRAWPLPAERCSVWRGRLGARLVNCGCWIGEGAPASAVRGMGASWAGACVIVDDDGPPIVKLLEGALSDRRAVDT